MLILQCRVQYHPWYAEMLLACCLEMLPTNGYTRRKEDMKDDWYSPSLLQTLTLNFDSQGVEFTGPIASPFSSKVLLVKVPLGTISPES